MPAYSFVDDILDPYMRECSSEKRISTQKAESSIANRLREFFVRHYISFSDSKMKHAINGSKVREYRERRKEKGVNPLTVRRELALASAACNYAIAEWDYSMPNPFEKRLISRKDERAVRHKRRKRIVTPAEQKQLILRLSPLLQDLLLFSVLTGLRQREMIELRWDQLHGNQIHFEPEQQKNGTFGKQGLSKAAQEIIARQPDEGELVFTRNGKKIEQRWLQREYKKIREEVGIADTVWKDLRKTCGTRMLAAGGRIEDVKNQLGHSDVRVTQEVYAEDDIEGTLEVLERVG
ncbi:MAG: tyrosine-type recombinase/integrase [Hoeflea sp. D1-CHI-28]